MYYTADCWAAHCYDLVVVSIHIQAHTVVDFVVAHREMILQRSAPV